MSSSAAVSWESAVAAYLARGTTCPGSLRGTRNTGPSSYLPSCVTERWAASYWWFCFPECASFRYPHRVAAELIDVRDGVALAQLGPLCIALWRESVTRERFDRQAAALARVVAAHRGNAGFLCIVEPESKPPNDELRRAAARMIDGHGSDLVFVAAVIEGSGFQASITRSVLTAMSLFLPRNKTKIGYFSSVMDAALWGCEQAALPPARTIAARIQELRAELAGGR